MINGHKWFTSNGRRAAFAIVMCRTEGDDDGRGVRDRMTQIIVPTDTPGFNIVRSVPVWGHEQGDHCEIKYENVRVPLDERARPARQRPPGRAGPARRGPRVPLHERASARCGARST